MMKGIYLVVILYVVTLGVIALDESPVTDIPTKCPEVNPRNKTVFLPHESDCTKFYSCHMGIKGKPLICPVMDDSGNRLHFNPKLQVCDWPWRAGCQTSSSTSSSFPTTITTPNSSITTSITSTSNSPTPTTPSPTSPTPTTPSPSSPTPTTPSPSSPTPTTPSPSSPTPTTPSPSPPTPTISSPSSPTPTTPSPSSPTPTTPSPSSPTPTTPSPSSPTPTTPSTNSCVSDNRIHMLPHKECDHYYLCFNSTINPIPQKCDRNLLFNPELRVCDFPENVNCTNIPSTIVPSTIRSLITIWMSPNSLSTPSFFPMSKSDPICACKSDGEPIKVPHETMCDYYYWCVNGIKGTKAIKCENDLLFNLNSKICQCDYPINVDCNNRNTPSQGTTVTTVSPPTTTTGCPTTTTTTECPPITTTTESPTTTTTTGCPTITTTTETPTTSTTTECPTTTTTTESPTTTTTTGCPTITTTTETPTTTTTTGCPTTTTTTETPTTMTTTETSTTPDPNKPREKCPPKGSTEKARIVHPCLCNQYYECVNGEKILETCPFGKHFDYVREVCDWAAIVKCIRPIPTFDISTFDVPIDDYNTTCAPEGRAFQHETDCSAYYLCSNGEKSLRHCVEGLHFNMTIQTCDYPQKSCDLKKPMPIIDLNSCPLSNSIQRVFLSHECEYTQYYECINGKQVLRSCPNGLHFDRVRQICNDPTEVKCVSSFAPTVPKQWTPSIPDSDKCYDENNEMPHEYDCRSYYKCSNGEKILKICPKNLYFNPKLRVCDFSENVACNTGSPNVPNIPIKCDTMTETKIPHETDCNLYYVCNDDVSTLKKCHSPELVFNPILKVCDFPENYICNVTQAKNNIEKTIETMIQNLDPSTCIGTCPEEDPEYAVLLPNEDCKKFCMCSGGTAWVQSCPDPLYFDSVEKVCKRKKNAVCGKRSFDQDGTFTIHNVADENDSMQLLSEKNTEKRGIYNNFWYKPHFYNLDPSKCIGTCPEEDPEYAVLLPNEDCKKFCMCSGGTAWVQSCPEPLYFDSVKKVCKRKKDAVCGKRLFDQDDTFTIHNVADEDDSIQLLSKKNTKKHGIHNNWSKPHFYNLDPSKCIGTCPEEDPEYAVLLPNEDCKKFCMCSGGTAWVQSCPEPLYFDSVKKVCKRKKDAVCGKRLFNQDNIFTIHNVADENDSMQLLSEKNTEKHGIYNNFWSKPHFYNLDPSKCIGTCPEEDPEYAVLLPNEDCKKFCMCSGGTAWVQSCPEPLYFDSVKKVCKRKKDAVCGKRSFDQDDTFTIHNVADEDDSMQLLSEKNTEKLEIYNNFWSKPHFYNFDPSKCIGTCPEEDPEYAVLLPNEDCKKFCMCSGGTAWVQSCPEPLYFDSVEKVCKRKKDVVCGTRLFEDHVFMVYEK